MACDWVFDFAGLCGGGSGEEAGAGGDHILRFSHIWQYFRCMHLAAPNGLFDLGGSCFGTFRNYLWFEGEGTSVWENQHLAGIGQFGALGHGGGRSVFLGGGFGGGGGGQ